MRVKLFGRYYTLVRVYMKHNEGLCDAPDTPGKKIRICTTSKNKGELETLLHEMLHACDFYKDEAWVKTAANDMANVLWRMGYRKQKDLPPVDPPPASG